MKTLDQQTLFPRGLVKEHAEILSITLRALDIVVVSLSGISVYCYKFESFYMTRDYVEALSFAALLMAVVFPWFGLYRSVRTHSWMHYIRTLIQAMSVVLILLAGFAFLTKTGEHFSRSWFLLWGIVSVVSLLLLRCALLLFLRLCRSRGWNERRVIIIGAGKMGQALIAMIQQAPWTGFRIIHLFDDAALERDVNGVPILKTPVDLEAYFITMKETVDEIWLALPLKEEERAKELIHALRHQTISVRFVMDLLGLDLTSRAMTDVLGFPALNINVTPMMGINRYVKAIEDRVLAALILIGISPLFAMIAILIKWTSKGPVLFKQLRHGWDGRIIKVYKFRTMFEHAESGLVSQARAFDARVTPLGRWLRKTSLDELPQFINVLQGRMSIVGPRPHAVSHNEYYKDSINAYMQRHKVKPGITGWAQVNGWRGETDTLEKMQKRIEYDFYYIDHWSLALDLKIIWLTLFKGFIHRNAY